MITWRGYFTRNDVFQHLKHSIFTGQSIVDLLGDKVLQLDDIGVDFLASVIEAANSLIHRSNTFVDLSNLDVGRCRRLLNFLSSEIAFDNESILKVSGECFHSPGFPLNAIEYILNSKSSK